MLRLLQEVKSDDLERDIIKHACSGFGSSQHAFEPRHQPDLSGHVVEVENGKVAVLVRWFRGAPETVMVFKKGNVKRKAIVDALTHIAAGVKTRCTR
ncbi:hypothetical protein HY971_01745 [Candidatus Kaiserbacteria bacterium]|nr:hypothetical protein [Candidatus Kaiserbacteria bacterium]